MTESHADVSHNHAVLRKFFVLFFKDDVLTAEKTEAVDSLESDLIIPIGISPKLLQIDFLALIGFPDGLPIHRIIKNHTRSIH